VRYRGRYLLAFVCLLAATTCGLGIPWTVKRAIEALERDAASAPIGRLVGVLVLLAGANAAARITSRFAAIGAAQRVEADLRNDLYAALQSFSPALFASRSTGDLMARATSDVAAVKSVVGFGAVTLMGTGFAFIGALTAMAALDPWLTVLGMLPYPALVLVIRRLNSRLHDRADAVQRQLGVLSSRVQEYLAGMAVVRAYAMESQAMAAFGEANAEFVERSLGLARLQASFAPLMGLIGGVGTLAVLWLGGKGVVDGRLTLGALVAFNGYMAYLTWPTLALGWTLSTVRRGLTSMARIQEVLDAAPVTVALDATPARWEGGTSVRFSDVTFAYGDRGPALIDVTFDVGEGTMVAIVGPTGSGKSTLGLLLARLWEPPAGTVFLGDEDVTKVELAALRSAIGYVPQESFLFSRSLLANVTLGREDIGLAESREAARAAGVADEIERLPQGFDTVVGERGLTLSGGQRQRVALGRAIAGLPPVLVLDDVFSNVDAAKEEEIVANLREIAVGRTVVLITHRLRAARMADRIVVLAGGRVEAVGRHDELIDADGLYARLWRVQQLEEAIARAP
jgi:ATP-binding cassette, subfamily B, multidrug efflux pump